MLERRGFLKPNGNNEVLTTPSAFPALGHGVMHRLSNPPLDLLAQKLELFVPSSSNLARPRGAVNYMDLGIILAILMLVAWAVATFAYEAPGWVHGLLTLGVFLLIWRIVVRGTRAIDRPDSRTRRADSDEGARTRR